ncbi:hypothetical protein GGF31_008424 [Allomyces arbusculus]|nr:hypothetical protein GGF31_008424 [Allomyces arbusculus]
MTTVPTTVPRLVTATQSLAITKELVKSALAAILLRRGLYEPDQFVPLKLVDADVPALQRDHPGNARLLQVRFPCANLLHSVAAALTSLIDEILHDGIFDALARGHLHEAMVSVYRGAKTNVLETYTLTVEYSAPAADGMGRAMAATSGRTPTVRIHVRRGDAAPIKLGTASAATVDALRAQVARALADLDQAVASLEPLPPRCNVTMYVTYQSTAPVDYEPAHFIPCAFPPTPPPSAEDLTMIGSPFHAVTMAIAARVGDRPPPDARDSATVAAARQPGSTIPPTPPTPPAPAVPPRRARTTRSAHSISSTRFRLPASPPTGPPSSTPPSTPPHTAATALSTPHIPPRTSPAPPTHPPFPNDLPTRAPDGTVVACVCQMNEPDMHLVECDICGKWSHVVCWGYFHGLDARLPESFACHDCAETGEPEQELALVRTAASVLWNEVPAGDAWAAENLALRMKINLDLAHYLFAILVDLGYVHHRTSPTTASQRGRRSRSKSAPAPSTTLYFVLKSDPRAVHVAKTLFDPSATHLPPRATLHPVKSRTTASSSGMVVPASYLSARTPSAASSVTDDDDQYGTRAIPALPDLALVAASARSRVSTVRAPSQPVFRKPPSPRRLSQAARARRPTTAESQATVVLPASQMSTDASTQGGAAETGWPWLPERSASQRAAQRVREVLKAEEEEEDPFRMPASAEDEEEEQTVAEVEASRGRGTGRGRGGVKRGRSVSAAAAAAASGRGGGGASAKRVKRKA